MATNTEIVRRAFAAFARRDIDALLALTDPAIEFLPPTAGAAGRAEPYRGHDGLRAYLSDVGRVWRELRPEPDDIVEVGDLVVCTGRIYAWGEGRVVDAPAAWVWRLREGRIAEGRVYESWREAHEAAGLTPPR